MSNDTFTTHGANSWIELYTEDKAQTKRFYSELFNWEISEMDMPDGSSYSIIKVNDAGIGGIVENKEAKPGNGGWGLYITVDSVDASLEAAVKLSGKVIIEAFDAPGVGRMAKLSDPCGASLSIITYAPQS